MVIEVKGVTKVFGRKLILKGIDFAVKEGESLTILGPNGAGKTTLIKLLATLLKPSSGSIRIAGFDIRDSSMQIRRSIGVVGHQTYLYDELTAYENLKFYGNMYDVPNLDERIHHIISEIGLETRLHDRVSTLSRGMQQRLSIARATIHNPPIILLDEPETGLDQHASKMLVEILDALYSNKRTVVMATHNMERGLEIGNHVMILSEGKIAYEESKQSLNLASLREAYQHYTGAIQ